MKDDPKFRALLIRREQGMVRSHLRGGSGIHASGPTT
jgi:hypothetical protein